MEFVINSTY